jgi:hypothetical protein
LTVPGAPGEGRDVVPTSPLASAAGAEGTTWPGTGAEGPVGLAVVPATESLAMASKSTLPVFSRIVMWSSTVWLASEASCRTSVLRVEFRTAPMAGKILPWAARSRFTNLYSYSVPLAADISRSQPCCCSFGWFGSSTPSCAATILTRLSRSV